jgi:glycosyltransferase involved in cell wall biosynthesis
MKKILIINKDQFGYHVDTYMYSLYLRESHQVTYMCLDQEKVKIDQEGINVIYCDLKFESRLLKRLFFIIETRKRMLENEYILIKYFFGSSLLLYGFRDFKILLDIRTRSVRESRHLRIIENSLLFIESRFFRNLSVVSSTLGRLIRRSDARVIPLGTYSKNVVRKRIPPSRSTHPYLLYVGTIEQRDFDVVVKGYYIFKRRNPTSSLEIKIVTGTTGLALTKIRELITSLQLSEMITLSSWKDRDELIDFFENASGGIVQVPNSKRYRGQPSTKLFEYLSFNLPLICSIYTETLELSSKPLGVFYEPSAENFAVALEKFLLGEFTFDTKVAEQVISGVGWVNIVSNHLAPYLLSIE